MTREHRRIDDLLPLIRRNCSDLTAWRNNFRALDNLRAAIFIQHGYKRFAYRELGEHGLSLYLWILPERLRSGFHRLLIARGKGA